MTTHTAGARRRPLWLSLVYLIPVFGWIARDTAEKGEENLYYGAFLIAALWAISVLLFGVPGLVLPALLSVPVLVATLIALTWG